MLINHQIFINILCQHMSAACNELRKDEHGIMSGFACHWRQSPAQPTLEGLSQGILHSWQGILCGFRRNARLCTGMQGWIVRSPKMQLDGNRVILSCVLTIIASFKMFQLEGRGYCVSQPSSGDYRALPTTIACKCKLKGAPEPQSCKTSAKLLNPSISDMDVLHVILRLSSKKRAALHHHQMHTNITKHDNTGATKSDPPTSPHTAPATMSPTSPNTATSTPCSSVSLNYSTRS